MMSDKIVQTGPGILSWSNWPQQFCAPEELPRSCGFPLSWVWGAARDGRIPPTVWVTTSVSISRKSSIS